MNWQVLNWDILGPAFIAGLLVLSTHVPLGREVLQRGIIFIDLAIAQVAGLGIILAAVLGWDLQGWLIQLIAVTAAIGAALVLKKLEQHWPSIQEALIGVLFVLAATGSILLLANNPHGGEHLQELLVGQILWVTWQDLWMTVLLYVCVLLLWFLIPWLREKMFYVLFAVCITASVQLVGVYLVFATLIVPALAVRWLKSPWQLGISYLMGALGYALGLACSALLDLPAGAMIVWSLVAVALVMSVIISSGK